MVFLYRTLMLRNLAIVFKLDFWNYFINLFAYYRFHSFLIMILTLMVLWYSCSGYIIVVRIVGWTLYAILLKLPWLCLDIDGAYFGTTFPHLFLMTYGQLKPQKPAQGYVPRVFGFKLHKPWSWKVKLSWKWEAARISFNSSVVVLLAAFSGSKPFQTSKI